MNLEQQVTSLELSKCLKDLGVKQESLFYWIKKVDHLETIRISGIIYITDLMAIKDSEEVKHDLCSAFTAAELLNLLPISVHTDNHEPFNNYRLALWKTLFVEDPMDMKITYNYLMNYECDTHLATDKPWDKRYLTKNVWDQNPANAMAKMLIYLYQNGLMQNES